MKRLTIIAKLFIALMLAVGVAVLTNGILHLKPASASQFVVYLVLTLAASRLRVRLPGVNGTMSVNLPFFLIIATQLSAAEALLIACLGSIVQSLPRANGRFNPVRIVFNAATVTSAVALGTLTFKTALADGWVLSLGLAASAAAFFLANTVPVAIVLWLAEEAQPINTWTEIARLTLPYYVLSAGVAAIVCGARSSSGVATALVVFAVMCLMYISYQRYFGETATQPKPAETVAIQARAAHT